ncbi:MAG TPA: hypothetical protein VE174_12950 [Actinomycetota bacterium]|nr:hypothetical protein [Actinomycetota bacterium]
MRGIGNERGVVISWLMKLLVGLAIVSVVMFDAGSILVNHVTLDTAANDTALALSLAIDPDQFGTNDEEVFEGAKEIVASNSTNAGGAKVVRSGTNVDEEGVIHVKLKRVADTFVVERIEAIKKWGRATAEGQASTD